MMDDRHTALMRVLTAFHVFRTPARVRDAILDRVAVDMSTSELGADEKQTIVAQSAELHDSGIDVIAVDDARFPTGLVHRGRAITPALFFSGNAALLSSGCVAVSGSREVSERGAAAATRLGEIAAAQDLCLVAGNARGVDTLAATSALASGGNVILVLPEGITRFSAKPEFRSLLRERNHLIVSQFEPGQRWVAHNAMARNRVICGLATSVVVIEARDSGGSLAAGREALKLGRRLVTLTYGDQTPPGNQILVDEGATVVETPGELREALANRSRPPEQGTLL